MANISDTIVAYKILKALGTKWTEFDAYKMGLIDNKGSKLRSPENPKEREAYSSFYKMIFNMKRLLQKFVGVNPTVNQLASLFLLKEGYSKETADKVVSELKFPTDTEKMNESIAELQIREFLTCGDEA